MIAVVAWVTSLAILGFPGAWGCWTSLTRAREGQVA